MVRTGTLLLEGVVEGVDPLADLGRGAVAEDCVGARVVGEDGVGWGGFGAGSVGSAGSAGSAQSAQSAQMMWIGLGGHMSNDRVGRECA